MSNLDPSSQVLLSKDKTFEIIKTAVNKLVNMVRPTFGPASNKVIISKQISKGVFDDGVQIARDFELEDPLENSIIDIIRETAIKTNDRVGDGTTGSLLMLQAIINEVARKNFNGRKTELELHKASKEAVEALKKMAKPIKSKEDIKKVALVSFDNEEVAEMISELYHKLGQDAVITIDKSPTMEITKEMSEGVKLDRGYISPYMINNPERMEASLEKPYILITDYRLTEASDLVPIMNKMAKENKRELVVICDNIEQSALSTAVVNKLQGKFYTLAINTPSVKNKKVFLEDLAKLTGAKLFSEGKGDKLEEAEIEDLGRAERITSKRDETVIVKPKGDKTEISTAILQLRASIENETKQKIKDELKQRLGMYTNKLAVIRVGASTESEQKALKYKVEDAVHSVKSALEGGVVAGSGLALTNIKTSSNLLNEALKHPARQVRENMGLDDTLLDEAENLVTGEKGNFMDIGVIDPVDVLIAGIESAVSIAGILLTSHGIIKESPTPKKGE